MLRHNNNIWNMFKDTVGVNNLEFEQISLSYPKNIYLFKVTNRNTWECREIVQS